MANVNLILSKEAVNDRERLWDLNLEGNVVSISYGLKDGNLQESVKTFEEGKAGRTPEQEALKYAYRKASEKVEADYSEAKGSFQELEDLYEESESELAEAKEAAREAKRLEKEEAREQKRLEREAEKAAAAEADERDEEVA